MRRKNFYLTLLTVIISGAALLSPISCKMIAPPEEDDNSLLLALGLATYLQPRCTLSGTITYDQSGAALPGTTFTLIIDADKFDAQSGNEVASFQGTWGSNPTIQGFSFDITNVPPGFYYIYVGAPATVIYGWLGAALPASNGTGQLTEVKCGTGGLTIPIAQS